MLQLAGSWCKQSRQVFRASQYCGIFLNAEQMWKINWAHLYLSQMEGGKSPNWKTAWFGVRRMYFFKKNYTWKNWITKCYWMKMLTFSVGIKMTPRKQVLASVSILIWSGIQRVKPSIQGMPISILLPDFILSRFEHIVMTEIYTFTVIRPEVSPQLLPCMT